MGASLGTILAVAGNMIAPGIGGAIGGALGAGMEGGNRSGRSFDLGSAALGGIGGAAMSPAGSFGGAASGTAAGLGEGALGSGIGAAPGSGLGTIGTSTGGLGLSAAPSLGGDLGSAIGTTTSGLGFNPAAVSGALSPGFFSNEFAPSTGPLGGGGATSNRPPMDLLSIASRAGPGLLGAYASNKEAKAYQNLGNQMLQVGAPYRQLLSDLYARPDDFLKSARIQAPIQQGSDILARSLSTGGNPVGSGNALQQLQNFASTNLYNAFDREASRLGDLGGVSTLTGAAPGALGSAIGAKSNIYNALGGAAADVFNPRQRINLNDIFRNFSFQ